MKKVTCGVRALAAAVALLATTLTWAGPDENEIVGLTTKEISLECGDGIQTLKEVLAQDNLGRLASFYQPTGAEIANLKIHAKGAKNLPRIEFVATKRVLLAPITQRVKGDMSVADISNHCKNASSFKGSWGTKLMLDLSDSSVDVTNNAKSYMIDLCAKEENGKVVVHANAFLKKGRDFGVIAGPMVRDLLAAQTEPLIKALKLAIEEKLRARKTG